MCPSKNNRKQASASPWARIAQKKKQEAEIHTVELPTQHVFRCEHGRCGWVKIVEPPSPKKRWAPTVR